MSRRRNKKYSAELKLQAVQDYLTGGGSQREICKKYEILDHHTLRDWILGYRQMTITINREYHTNYNIKRIRRLMRILHLQSVCRKKRYNYIKSTPEFTAENILNREFYADAPNEKWLTDVTEFKYYVGVEVKKLYLSAILVRNVLSQKVYR